MLARTPLVVGVVGLLVTLGIGVAARPAVARRARAAAHKKGRVVRVERGRGGAQSSLRICMQVQSNGVGYCYGRAVRAGEVGTVIDENGAHGTIEVSTVTPTVDRCQNETQWNITSTVQSGDLTPITYNATALFDAPSARTTRLITNTGQVAVPSQRPGETLWVMFDDSGDDQPDLIVTYYQCELTTAPVTSGIAPAYCMVYYTLDGGQYEEQRIDVVKNCQ